jgi:hypothetical protein
VYFTVVSSISEQDNKLDSNLQELDLGTRSRNREFQARLDEIWASAGTFEGRLRTEVKEAADSILNMKENYQNHLDRFHSSFLSDINSIFDKYDKDDIPTHTGRLESIDLNLDDFIKKTVPANIEQHSGEVSRQLRRSYEMFNIERKKEAKRCV